MKNKLSKMLKFRWKSSIREEGVTKQTAFLFFFFCLLVGVKSSYTGLKLFWQSQEEGMASAQALVAVF